MKLKVGDRVTRSLSQGSWIVTAIDDESVHRLARCITLERGTEWKKLRLASVIATYTLIGSERFKILVAAYRRHGWSILEEYE